MGKVVNQDMKHMGCSPTHKVKNCQVYWPTRVLNFKLEYFD